GDKDNFNIAGDGTCMPTHASHRGKKICSCDLKPGHSCDCMRKFMDPTASWGWDSYNEAWFYGHSFHCFTACDSFYSLPIHIKCVTAERHDSVTGVYALAELLRLYPEFWFKTAVFDSAYDSNYFYLLNLNYGINPVIDLNERASKPVSCNELIEYDEYGIPHGKVCGLRFRNWGLMQESFRRKWLFPAQCDNCNRCPAKSNWCKYTPTKENPRYFSPILRGTDEWRSRYKRRSTTERLWDRVKLDFKAETAVVYSKEQRIVRVFLGAFCCYIDAWFNESSLRITDIFPGLQGVAA
ncbi:MAG: transposase, partial [Candidatus Kryptoniota bacterium]